MKFRRMAAVLGAGAAVLAAAPAAQASPAHQARPTVAFYDLLFGTVTITTHKRPVPYQPETLLHIKIRTVHEPHTSNIVIRLEKWAPDGGPYSLKKWTITKSELAHVGHTKEFTLDTLCRPGTYYAWTRASGKVTVISFTETVNFYDPSGNEPARSKPPTRHESHSIKSCP